MVDGIAWIGKSPPASAVAQRQTGEAPSPTYVLQQWDTSAKKIIRVLKAVLEQQPL